MRYNKHLYLPHEKTPWVVYIRLCIHFYSLTSASCMSNSPFKNHKVLRSQALHNGLFQKLHSAYICMKKLQGKKSSSAYLSFGQLIKKVIGFIFTISVKSLESNHNCFFHVTDEWPVPWPQRNTSPRFVQVHQDHGYLLLAQVGNIRCAAALLALFPFSQHIKRLI